MQITFSKSGTPLIELENGGKLIFSKTTAHPYLGYKFICYSGQTATTTCISGAKVKNKKYAKIVEDDNFTVRVKDFRRSDKQPFKTDVLSPIMINFLKKKITSLTEGDYFPYDNIPVLNDILAQLNNGDDDFCDDDPTATESWDDVHTKNPKTPKKKIIKRRPKDLRIKNKPKKKMIRFKRGK